MQNAQAVAASYHLLTQGALLKLLGFSNATAADAIAVVIAYMIMTMIMSHSISNPPNMKQSLLLHKLLSTAAQKDHMMVNRTHAAGSSLHMLLTLMTATPPASFAIRSLSFSVSYTESVSLSSFLICLIRMLISSLFAASAISVVLLLITFTCTARFRLSKKVSRHNNHKPAL